MFSEPYELSSWLPEAPKPVICAGALAGIPSGTLCSNGGICKGIAAGAADGAGIVTECWKVGRCVGNEGYNCAIPSHDEPVWEGIIGAALEPKKTGLSSSTSGRR